MTHVLGGLVRMVRRPGRLPTPADRHGRALPRNPSDHAGNLRHSAACWAPVVRPGWCVGSVTSREGAVDGQGQSRAGRMWRGLVTPPALSSRVPPRSTGSAPALSRAWRLPEQDPGHGTPGLPLCGGSGVPTGIALSGRRMAVSGSSANQGDHADPDQQEPETHQSASRGWWAISGLRRRRAPADQVR